MPDFPSNSWVDLPKPGSRWEHYKGGQYTVICIAICSETGKDLVIYRSDEKRNIYARPLDMWYNTIATIDRGPVKRFTEIK
jgi:hypothetical protein